MTRTVLAAGAVAVLLGGCVTSGQQAADASRTTTPTPASVSPEPKLDDRAVRIAIARMLESQFAYRGIFESGAPKLYDAKLFGPWESKPLFGNTTVIKYCAEAEVGKQLIPIVRRASISIHREADGKVRLGASIPITGPVPWCGGRPAQPFPEFERAREQRRQALGLT